MYGQGKIVSPIDSAKSLQPERQPRYLEIDDMLDRLSVSVDGLFSDLDALKGEENDKKDPGQIKPTKIFADVYCNIAERVHCQCNKIEEYRIRLSELLK